MPRKGRVTRREIAPDIKYNNILVHKLINKVMEDGKKGIAENIVYTALEAVAEKLNISPVEVLNRALENVKPVWEVRPRRVGGATYQVPVEVEEHRRESLGIKWIVEAARSRARHRGSYTMTERLAAEIVDAIENKGTAVKKKEDTHRMAEANKVFAHFKW